MNPKTFTLSALLLLTPSASAGGFQPAQPMQPAPTQTAAEHAPIYLPQAAAPAKAAGSANAQAEAFRAVPCPEDVATTRCGYVSVPLDHAQPEGKQIELFVAVQENAKADEAPLFYVEGGPGGASSVAVPMLGQFFSDTNIVGIDQRGIGRSVPLLECPEIEQIMTDPDLTTPQLNTAYSEAMLACGEKLRAAGIELEAFNTTQAAADVETVRRALGYEQINLYGASYGTRLAQEVMRRHPEGLRAVVLDSVIPTQVDRTARTAQAMQESLQNVFASCASDAMCQAAYPQLEQTYAKTLAQLSEEPLEIDAKYGGGGVFDHIALQNFTISSLYFAPSIIELPKLIYAARDGDTAFLENSLAAQFISALNSGVTWTAYFTNECVGEVAYSSPERLQAGLDAAPEFAAALASAPGISSAGIFPLCQGLGLSDPAPLENDPVESDVPTLLLAGEYDPVTPAAWLAEAKGGLSNSQSVVITGASHGSGFLTPCGIQLMTSFFGDPSNSLDLACAQSGALDWSAAAVQDTEEME